MYLTIEFVVKFNTFN